MGHRVFAHGRSIEQRPKSVALRQEFGHFEVDMMQSGETRGDVLVTITERLSRQHIIRHVSGRNSHAVTPVIIQFFSGIKNAKSITVDHGREFAKYDTIETGGMQELDQINHWVNEQSMKTFNWQSPRQVVLQHVES